MCWVAEMLGYSAVYLELGLHCSIFDKSAFLQNVQNT